MKWMFLGIHENKLVISNLSCFYRTVRKLSAGVQIRDSTLAQCTGLLALVCSTAPPLGRRGIPKYSQVMFQCESSLCSPACFFMTPPCTQPGLAFDLQSSCLSFQITNIQHHSQLPLLLIFMFNNRKKSTAVFL